MRFNCQLRGILVCALLSILLPIVLFSQRIVSPPIGIVNADADSIDLGLACLIMAKEAYPNLDIQTFDKMLDYMAGQIEQLMEGNNDPEARIGMLNTYLYREGW